jgi:hypothetical protein
VERGYKHVMHCLPRMLTLYCDFGSDQLAAKSAGSGARVKERTAASQVID